MRRTQYTRREFKSSETHAGKSGQVRHSLVWLGSLDQSVVDLVLTFILLDGEHRQRVDDLVLC